MIALRLFHRAEVHPPIACPVSCSDRRVGVPVPAFLPRRRQAVGRNACVLSAYPQELPSHNRPRSPWSEITTGVFEHVQKVFADIANVEC